MIFVFVVFPQSKEIVMSVQQLAFYQEKLAWEIDSWDLYVALNNRENVVVVDGRSTEAFDKEHLPGAINLPHRTICENAQAHLDKSALCVTYCDGIGCNASTKTALKVLTLGFRVKENAGWPRLVEARWLRDARLAGPRRYDGSMQLPRLSKACMACRSGTQDSVF
jgi:rhodanese-related sulfurtransferase